MKILIGYDGSECADAALTDLKNAGLPDDTEAFILSAVDVFIPPKPDVKDLDDPFVNYVPHGVKLARKRARKAFDEAKTLAACAGEKVRKMFPNWRIEAEAVADTPHWAIIAKAEQWKTDLTVVGSHGPSILGRAILGSVSQKVLYESKCSVRIARGKEKTENDPVRLILGADGTPDSDAMIEEVVRREWNNGTQATLVTSVEAFSQKAFEPDAQLNRVRDLQALAAEKLTAAGISVNTIVTEEDPKYFLVRLAETQQADCIFLGARGHSFLERFLLGSISSAVAARAICSVEVVRRKLV